jgi:Cu(I)/Ag(I) efflux system protein CusF
MNMKLKSITRALIISAALSSAVTLADSSMPGMSGEADKMSSAGVDSRGTVTAIDTKSHRVTLKHEAIPQLKWPPMTMGFAVSEDVKLEGLNVGDQVNFTLIKTKQGQTVQRLEK